MADADWLGRCRGGTCFSSPYAVAHTTHFQCRRGGKAMIMLFLEETRACFKTRASFFMQGSFSYEQFSTVVVPPRNNDHVCTLFATTSYAISS